VGGEQVTAGAGPTDPGQAPPGRAVPTGTGTAGTAAAGTGAAAGRAGTDGAAGTAAAGVRAEEVEPAGSRWAALAAYGSVAACTQMLWLTYAPITTDAAAHYRVSEGAIGTLANVFPVLYVVLAIPTGRLLDRAFRPALAAGAVLTAAGGLVRLAGDGFGAAVAGQLLVAVAQPLVLNAVTTIAGSYLAYRHRATGIALGSASLFAGMIAAFVLGSALGADALRRLLLVQAALGVVAAAALLVTLRRPGPFAAATAAATPAPGALRRLLGQAHVRHLVALVFLGFGVFIALSTWLQALLEPDGVSAQTAGVLLLAMVVAGTIGSALIPTWAARRGRRVTVLRASIAAAVAGCAALAIAPGTATAAIALTLIGLLLLADLPILLEVAETRSARDPGAEAGDAGHPQAAGDPEDAAEAEDSGHPEDAGEAAVTAGGDGATLAALLWLAGNAGGVVVALAVQGLLDHPGAAFSLLAGVTLLAAPFLRSRWLDEPGAPARPSGQPPE
jgi:predicted MFS family arabinose efflux permease